LKLETWKHKEDERADTYSEFLHEGDFEKYMPFIETKPKDEELLSQRELVRALWIRQRFTHHQRDLWFFYDFLLVLEYKKLLQMIKHDSKSSRLKT